MAAIKNKCADEFFMYGSGVGFREGTKTGPLTAFYQEFIEHRLV